MSTDQRFIYRHRWQVGDLLIWDNCSTQHLAIPDYALPQRRLMERTTVARGSSIAVLAPLGLRLPAAEARPHGFDHRLAGDDVIVRVLRGGRARVVGQDAQQRADRNARVDAARPFVAR